MSDGVVIDGATGEGSGHVIRTALSLSAATGRPLRLVRIREGTGASGLTPHDLLTVKAVGRTCGARVAGAEVGSRDVWFVPGEIRPATFGEEVPADGAIGPVLQAVALPLCMAADSSRVKLRGSTHVPGVPGFDFLASDWVPAMEAAGLPLTIKLAKAGYPPRGGGEIIASFPGHGSPKPMIRRVRENLRMIRGTIFFSRMPRTALEQVAKETKVHLRRAGVAVKVVLDGRYAEGPGAGIHLVAILDDGTTSGFTFLADRRGPERMARQSVNALFAWLDTGAALNEWLADQILVPLALARAPSVFTTSRVTRHLLTSALVAQRFLPVRVEFDGAEGSSGEVRIHAS